MSRRHSSSLVREFLEHSSLPAILVDIKSREMTDCNFLFTERYGWRKGMPLARLLPDTEWSKIASQYESLRESGGDAVQPWLNLAARSGEDESIRILLRTVFFDEKYSLALLLISGGYSRQDAESRRLSSSSNIEKDLAIRDNLLQSTSRAAQMLLSDADDFDETIQKVLALLGEASGADRVYVWSIHPGDKPEEDSELYTTQLYEWSLGAEPQQDLAICMNRPVSEAIPTWIGTFMAGKCVNNLVCNMPQAEQDQLSPQGIISIMTAPIMFHGHLWGFIGFDDCHCEHIWSKPEENILRAAGTLIGTAIHNRRINEALRESENRYRIVAQQSNTANVAKGEFLANMSHEIRTPMNAVIGFTNLVRQTELTDRQRDMVERIDSSARTLLRIINDILDFSKIEAGKLEIEAVEFEVEKVMRDVYTLVSHRATEKRLNLEFDVPGDIPTLMGDPLRLNQIIVNLATNAIKFTEKGKVKIGVSVTGNDRRQIRLNFSVHDTGIGIPPNKMGTLFTAFTQADSSHTRRYGGTGLGLALCKQLVELMGGSISCDSIPLIGSNFHFTLPFTKLFSDAPAADYVPGRSNISIADLAARAKTRRIAAQNYDVPAHHPLLSGKRVLLVEDNEMNQIMAREMLTQAGLKVSIADNGLKCLESLAREAFDVVLMDIQMPEMDGLTAAREIRKNKKLSSLPIIAVTAHAMVGDSEKSLAAGMNAHITKPLDPAQLLSCIADFCAPQAEQPIQRA